MSLCTRFGLGTFVVTGEVGPPKGASAQETLEGARVMAPCVDAVNVTDNQSAVMRLGSLAVASLLKQEGIDPVFQITCRDRNRIALQSDLLSAAALGVENILVLSGDHMVLGDHPTAKGVFDLDSVQLLTAATGLANGSDLEGHKLDSKPTFCLGAVVNPGSDDLDAQLLKMRKKINAGAHFFQTQAVYEVDVFANFAERANKLGVPIMAGVVPLKSAGMARYMNDNVAGVHVPQDMVERIGKAKKADRKKVSAEMAAEFIRQVKDLCQGIHLMPLGWDDLVPEIVSQSQIR